MVIRVEELNCLTTIILWKVFALNLLTSMSQYETGGDFFVGVRIPSPVPLLYPELNL